MFAFGRTATITTGAIDASLLDDLEPCGSFRAAKRRLLIARPGVATFLVRNGSEIHVEAEHGVDDARVHRALLASPMAALVQQGARPLLHAAAVRGSRGAVLFAGPTGVGKSALAAYCHRRGLTVLADDMAAVAPAADGGGCLFRGDAELRVPADAAVALGMRVASEEREAPRGKHVVGIEMADESVPLASIHLLEYHGGSEVLMRPVARQNRAQSLFQASYRPEFLGPMGVRHDYMEALIAFERTGIEIGRLLIPRGVRQLGGIFDFIVGRGELP